MTTNPEKYTNASGIECYKNVEPETLLSNLQFYVVDRDSITSCLWALNTNLGTFTVLNRQTGYGYVDTETGYRSTDNKFWLAAGDKDVRNLAGATVQEAIDWIKSNSNICRGE